MKSRSLLNTSLLLLAFFSLSLSSCKVSRSSDNTGDNTDDTETETTDSDTGATVPDPINGFSLVVTQNDNYSILVSKDGDGSTECKADEGEKISCIVDMNEHDLYINGLKLGWAAPQDQCDYIGQYHYYYAAYPVGVMPSAVIYFANDDGLNDLADYSPPAGTPFNTVWTAAVAAGCGADIVYAIDADQDGIIQGDEYYCHADLFTTVATEADSVRCPWDYSGQDGGKNCCYGDYTKFTYDGTDPAVDDGANWGDESNYANCFRGPGLSDFDAPKNVFGMPYYLTELVTTAGLQDSLNITAPWLTSHRNQIYAANYFNRAADHSGAGESATIASFHSASFVPGDNTVQAPINMAIGFPFYQIDCLDHDFELKAQIRVMVREWNTQAQFDSFASGSSGNPDVVGSSDLYSNGTSEQLDDYQDWKALEDASAVSFSQSVGLTYFQLNASIDSQMIWNVSNFYMAFPLR